MRSKAVRCQSGLMGSQYKLQDSYASFEEFKDYCRIYAIHTRLGYVSMKGAWDSNPTIQSSTEPSDLRRVYFHAVKKKDGSYRIKESVNRYCNEVKNSCASFSSKQFVQDWINK